MKNFFTRTLTAGAFVAVLLGCTYYSQLSFSILFFVITILGLWEFYSLIQKGGSFPQKIIGTIAGALFFLTNVFIVNEHTDLVARRLLLFSIPTFSLLFTFLVFIFELFRKKEHPFRNIAFTLLGIIYVALPFSLLNYITIFDDIYSFTILFGIFLYSGATMQELTLLAL